MPKNKDRGKEKKSQEEDKSEESNTDYQNDQSGRRKNPSEPVDTEDSLAKRRPRRTLKHNTRFNPYIYETGAASYAKQLLQAGLYELYANEFSSPSVKPRRRESKATGSRHEQSISLRDIKEEADDDEQSESKPLQKDTNQDNNDSSSIQDEDRSSVHTSTNRNKGTIQMWIDQHHPGSNKSRSKSNKRKRKNMNWTRQRTGYTNQMNELFNRDRHLHNVNKRDVPKDYGRKTAKMPVERQPSENASSEPAERRTKMRHDTAIPVSYLPPVYPGMPPPMAFPPLNQVAEEIEKSRKAGVGISPTAHNYPVYPAHPTHHPSMYPIYANQQMHNNYIARGHQFAQQAKGYLRKERKQSGASNPLASREHSNTPPKMQKLPVEKSGSPVSLRINLNGEKKTYKQVRKPGPCHLNQFLVNFDQDRSVSSDDSESDSESQNEKSSEEKVSQKSANEDKSLGTYKTLHQFATAIMRSELLCFFPENKINPSINEENSSREKSQELDIDCLNLLRIPQTDE